MIYHTSGLRLAFPPHTVAGAAADSHRLPSRTVFKERTHSSKQASSCKHISSGTFLPSVVLVLGIVLVGTDTAALLVGAVDGRSEKY
jgi:hypothetical protein